MVDKFSRVSDGSNTVDGVGDTRMSNVAVPLGECPGVGGVKIHLPRQNRNASVEDMKEATVGEDSEFGNNGTAGPAKRGDQTASNPQSFLNPSEDLRRAAPGVTWVTSEEVWKEYDKEDDKGLLFNSIRNRARLRRGFIEYKGTVAVWKGCPKIEEWAKKENLRPNDKVHITMSIVPKEIQRSAATKPIPDTMRPHQDDPIWQEFQRFREFQRFETFRQWEQADQDQQSVRESTTGDRQYHTEPRRWRGRDRGGRRSRRAGFRR
ncbi:hypothetical protein GL218_08899 [Daldinia childiae]|uniref:uncharacterized protein n=1 Tax=Daldinia childiae TaxID=326645 RepID=UPI001446D4F6|nr:uncharacterized protein GL218_08899 [Daldinia childiae]KAF3067050.1 hypothetical protein GL218_08899 [Daldinia childiae]